MTNIHLIVSDIEKNEAIKSEFFASAEKALEYADQMINRKPVGVIYRFSFFKGADENPYMETQAF